MSHSNLDPLASFTLCKLSFTFLHLLPGSQSYPLKQGDIRWLYQIPQISGLRTPQRGKSLAPIGSCFSPSTCSRSIFGYNYIPWPLHTGRSSVFSVHIHRLLRNLLLLDSEIPQAHGASWSPSAPPPWLLLQAQGLNSPVHLRSREKRPYCTYSFGDESRNNYLRKGRMGLGRNSKNGQEKKLTMIWHERKKNQ